MTQTIVTIRGREFEIKPAAEKTAHLMPYLLTSKRGATYGAFRFSNRPEILFLVGGTRSMNKLRIEGNEVWLTDAAGTVEEVRR